MPPVTSLEERLALGVNDTDERGELVELAESMGRTVTHSLEAFGTEDEDS
jgi:hypothetical protein